MAVTKAVTEMGIQTKVVSLASLLVRLGFHDIYLIATFR